MAEQLSSKPTYNKRVTRIDWNGNMDMSVYTQDTPGEPTTYAGVFSSTTLRCLKMIDTSRAHLAYPVKRAIRSLDYGPSAKVGIVFDRPWWRTDLVNPVTTGGLGHSDLTIRTCVYPSYNIGNDEGPHVLLVSYTWQQDAERIGSLMCSTVEPGALDHKATMVDEARLVELLCSDLARLHKVESETKTLEELYEMIKGSYKDHYAHDWTHDSNTAGAFAFFKPQQFQNLWPQIITPSNDFIFIGEVASPHHAWVVGAIESAVVGIYQWLRMNRVGLAGVEAALEVLKEGAKEKSGSDVSPFWGLPSWIPQEHADWIALLATIRKEEILSKMGEGENAQR